VEPDRCLKRAADFTVSWRCRCLLCLLLLLQPFYGPFVRDYPGVPVPEEALTHPPSWSSSNLYQLLPSTAIHSVASSLFKLRAWQSFHTTSFHVLFRLPLGLEPSTSYISSPNQCIHFAPHAHTIGACFAVVSILYHLFLVFLSTPYLEVKWVGFNVPLNTL